MRLTQAAAAIVALLGVAVILFRLQEEVGRRKPATATGEIRLGVVLPDGSRGLVVAPASELLNSAAENLRLPDGCLRLAAEVAVSDGDLLDFSNPGQTCTTLRLRRLGGALRLSAGLPLDINAEDAAGLSLLPGIGPQKGAAVEAYRRENGPFETVDDLSFVRGIGDKTVEKLRPWVVVGSESGDGPRPPGRSGNGEGGGVGFGVPAD